MSHKTNAALIEDYAEMVTEKIAKGIWNYDLAMDRLEQLLGYSTAKKIMDKAKQETSEILENDGNHPER